MPCGIRPVIRPACPVPPERGGICRILNAMWQVSDAHGPIDPRGAIEETFSYHGAGFTTWDLADHLWPGKGFRRDLPSPVCRALRVERPPEIQAFTNGFRIRAG